MLLCLVGGTPSQGGCPLPSRPSWGLPLIIKTSLGYPASSRPGWGDTLGTPHLDLAGVPPTPGMGYPQTWDGVHPTPDLRWGTPHHPDLDRVPLQTWDGVPPTIQTCMGYPPKMLTDRHLWKQYLPIILCMRAVIRRKNNIFSKSYKFT